MNEDKLGVFSIKTLGLMQEAAKALGLGKITITERDEEGDPIVVDIGEQFYITAVEGTLTYKSIGGDRQRQVTQYLLEEGIYEAGSYWEPPSSDVVEFGKESTPLNAIAAVAHRELDYRINNVFEALSYADLEESIFD